MKLFFLIFVGLLLPWLPVCAEMPTERGVQIGAGHDGGEWKWLFGALAAKGAVYSPFTELRWFPTRKEPVVLKGEMRLIPGRGLSLRYTEPEAQLMVVDTKGLLLRDAKGREREIKADARQGGMAPALLAVMQFDEAALLKDFDLYAVRSSDDWRLDFVPRDAGLAKALGSVIVWGTGTEISKLEFRKSERQRVEVLVESERRGAVFSDNEVKAFFR